MRKKKIEEIKKCRNPGLNQGPLDLQSNALPTELFRLVVNYKSYRGNLRTVRVPVHLNQWLAAAHL